MPYGHNTAICKTCGKPYITGDCIDLDAECSECGMQEVFDLSILGDQKAKLKMEIQTIMNDALSGAVGIYRLRQKGQSYIRWGRVQKHINQAIDSHWPKGKKKDE